MTDPLGQLDSRDERGPDPGRTTTATTPLAVKVFGIVVLIAVVLFVVLGLVGGGHVPGLHTPP